MHDDLIILLKEADDYISGEEISKIFGVTRAAVWKNIKLLKEKGYEIEGISKKGYKLISSPDLLLEKEIQKKLSTKFIGHNIKYFETITSTNEIAKKFARDITIPDGTLVISEIQSGGHGRFERAWTSPKGGLWFSIILKPNIEPVHASKITQIVAAALITTLNKMDINALIKWPNDIYVNDKKISGILTEMKCDMDRINYLVVGTGINVNLPKECFDDNIKDSATSLMELKGYPLDRTSLLTAFLEEFETMYLKFIKTTDFSEPLEICRQNSILMKKEAYHVTIRGKEKVLCLGIDEQGELIIQDMLGNVKTVLSGEITFK